LPATRACRVAGVCIPCVRYVVRAEHDVELSRELVVTLRSGLRYTLRFAARRERFISNRVIYSRDLHMPYGWCFDVLE
jgi:hypothetical protein